MLQLISSSFPAAPVTSYQYVCVWQKLIDSTVVQSLADLLHTMKMNPDAIAVLETLDEDVLRNEAIFLIKTPGTLFSYLRNLVRN